MDLANNIKKIRERLNIMQKEVALHIEVDKSTYSKIEKGMRELTAKELIKIAQLFEMSVDEIINYEGFAPNPVTLNNKTNIEQIRLFDELDEEDRKSILNIVDKMLTTKKFNNFFKENIKE